MNSQFSGWPGAFAAPVVVSAASSYSQFFSLNRYFPANPCVNSESNQRVILNGKRIAVIRKREPTQEKPQATRFGYLTIAKVRAQELRGRS